MFKILIIILISNLILSSSKVNQNIEDKLTKKNRYFPVEAKCLCRYDRPKYVIWPIHELTPEEYEEEEFLGDMELLALLVYAEAGNQGLKGMRLVADVVLNRRDDSSFPDTIEEVIYQERQFSVVKSGALDDAGWHITEEAFQAAELEMTGERLNYGILYFATTPCNGKNHFKYKDHWFGY